MTRYYTDQALQQLCNTRTHAHLHANIDFKHLANLDVKVTVASNSNQDTVSRIMLVSHKTKKVYKTTCTIVIILSMQPQANNAQ